LILETSAKGGGGNYSFLWSTASDDTTTKVTPYSSQVYSVTVTDDCGFKDFNQVLVDVSAPEAQFAYEYLDASNVVFENLSEDATSYLWEFGDTATSTEFSPWHQYDYANQWYVTLFAFDDALCVDSTFAILDPPLRVFIPSGFTPNGDGLNDEFMIYGEGFKNNDNIKSFLIRIYDRWGTEIFTSRDANFTWDGTIDGTPASVGTYVYKIRMEGYAKQKYEKTGNLTIPAY